MNRPLLQASLPHPDPDEIDLTEIAAVLREHVGLIGIVTAITLALGTAWALLATPVFRADAMIQVDDSSSTLNDKLGDLAAMFDGKAVADAEIELIRSRQVVGDTVSALHLDIDARPRYFPLLGGWVARHSTPGQLAPAVMGMRSFAWGGEAIAVSQFDVPAAHYDDTFSLVAGADHTYRLTDPDGKPVLSGKVGEVTHGNTADGPVTLRIGQLIAADGTQFRLKRASTQLTIERLQKDLDVKEKTKQSGIISISLDGHDSSLTQQTVNSIAGRYVQRNVEWKSAQAQQMLDFLDGQLPLIHADLNKAEARYNTFRNRNHTVDLETETKLLLQSMADAQTRILVLQQQRDELAQRFTPDHPSVAAIDAQLTSLRDQQHKLTAQVDSLPDTQLTALGLQRDVAIDTDLYTKLMDSAQQLRVLKAGQQGNARIVDLAVDAERPVWPKKALLIAGSLLVGFVLGVAAAFVRRAFNRGLETPLQIEEATGIPVYASISHSVRQARSLKATDTGRGPYVLAAVAPQDVAVEGIRSLRTALQFRMTRAASNVVMVTGPRPGVGKSFLSINLAAVIASAGKRVLLIDADLRRGDMEARLGLSRGAGLGEVLAGLPPDQAIRHVDTPQLDVLTRGKVTPNPAEVLMSERFASVIRAFSRVYDIVIVDTPPVLAVTDSTLIGLHAGTTLLAVRHGRHSAAELRETVRLLASAGVEISGIALGDVPARAAANGAFSSYESVDA